MKIFSAAQTRALDAYTIEHEPIASIDLMERASQTFTDWFFDSFRDTSKKVYLFCGIGNNGGDGLAIARLLHYLSYEVEVLFCKISSNVSPDCATNLQRLPERADIPIINLAKGAPFPQLEEEALIIDAIFGSGLNRPVEGYWAELMEWINGCKQTIIAVDMPSGVFADKHTASTSIKAQYTFSFEFPKLAFVFPENQFRIGKWHFGSIGLHRDIMEQTEVPYHYVDEPFARSLIRKRNKFDHKGTFGHALLIMGSFGKIGAAVLAAASCLRSGAGLVSVHAPKCAYEILQISLPEAMVSLDADQQHFSQLPDLSPYRAIGIGCGLGQAKESASALKNLLDNWNKPLLLDADALNILSKHQEWYPLIPKNSILTPHPKEFERLFGPSENDFERNALQRDWAQKLGCYIVLKGANTCISSPDRNCYFNSTGNPGMATAGSGDVLSGIITSLLAQSYSSFEAAILGVYLHGLAGDCALDTLSQEALIASDITQYLSQAFKKLNR